RLFRDAGLAGLAPGDKRGGKGNGRLDKAVEGIINEKIECKYLRRPGCSVSALVRLIKRACEACGLRPPSRQTVQNRVNLIPEYTVHSAQKGKYSARSKYHVSRGSFPGADVPLSVVQFDHSPLDIMIVDREYRISIGRPYLTCAIDVYSRMIYGYFLTLGSPSYESVAMCLLHGIQTKDKFLERFGIDAEDWPVHGLPACIHVDNAKEFRSKHLADFCAQYQTTLEYRPIKTPQYGAHIERLFRTNNEEIHQLDGTTFSSVHERGDYKSEDEARMTLDELEEFIVFTILEYHLSEHSILNMPPKLCWDKAFLNGLVDPYVPLDEKKMVIDLLPFDERTIQKGGVGMFGLHYTSESLQSIRHLETKSKERRQYRIKYDTRNISRIFLLNPVTKCYETLYLSDRRFGDISLIELKQIKKVLKHENKIFNTRNLGLYVSRKEELLAKAAAGKNSKYNQRLKERIERGKEHSKFVTGDKEDATKVYPDIDIDPSKVNLDDLE
ncbi:MAG TPA: DDE-type integrase/transposase/recombinase, partial [Anaerolineales bacterium]|nr:DDE-type integrase/transposase/recombinase [Anaerolineales bacterium]